MLIRFGYEILFDLPAPTPMVLLLSPHPCVDYRLSYPETIQSEPDLPLHEFIDEFGNRATRLVAPAGQLRLFYNAVAQDSGLTDIIEPNAIQHRIENIPDNVLPFLLDSRYCETELLANTAWELFGATHAAGLGARAGSLRLGALPCGVRLPSRPQHPHRRGRLQRASGCLPRFHAPGSGVLPRL